MIKTPTVLVFGAGMSAHYGLPLGNDLCTRIGNLIGSMGSAEAWHIRDRVYSKAELEKFEIALRNSAEHSIDSFLALRPDLQDIGRYLLTRVIQPMEAAGRLFDGNRPDHPYRHLFLEMKEGATKPDEILNNAVSFISFNYDRSLEFYITNTLAHTFGIDLLRAGSIVGQMRIHHVHGSFGKLKCMGGDLDYGGTFPSDRHQARSAEQILLVTDQVEDSRELRRAIDWLRSATRVHLLGFGFDPRNVRRLRLTDLGEKTEVSATGFRLGKPARHRAIAQFHSYDPPRLTIADEGLDCLSFLQDVFHRE